MKIIFHYGSQVKLMAQPVRMRLVGISNDICELNMAINVKNVDGVK